MTLFKLKPISDLDLAKLVRPTSPNTYFVCPEGFSTSNPDHVAPEFSQSAARLFDAWVSLVEEQPKTSELSRSTVQGWQITHVQRSTFLGYPDVITAEMIEQDGGGSTLAVYSRSQYGYSDMGANQKRVTTWLSKLSKAMG